MFISNETPSLLVLLLQTIRLGQKHRNETSRLVLGATGVLIGAALSGAYLLIKVLHAHESLDELAYSIGNDAVLILIGIGALIFFILVLHRVAIYYYRANEIALAEIEEREPTFVTKRAWVMVGLFLLIYAPLFAIQYLWSDADYGNVFMALSIIMISPLYISVPSAVKSGSVLSAIKESWNLARGNMKVIFMCAIVSWVPLVMINMAETELPSSLVPALVFTSLFYFLQLFIMIEYEPFYRAIIYRELQLKKEAMAV